MTEPKTDEAARLDKLMNVGDYRDARQLARRMMENPDAMSAEEKASVDRVIKVTGRDPFVIGGFLLTLGVIAFLVVKYVL
jgi:hypothetical protein